MPFAITGRILLVLALGVCLLSLTGCGSRAASAQRLFEKGEYQKVVDKYPDLEIARRARAKIAEGLFTEGKYEQVLREYRDTPVAYQAQIKLSLKWLEERKYQMVLDSFPHVPAAAQAKELMADSLFNSGQLDLLVQRFPESTKGKQVKEERGRAALEAAKKAPKSERRQKLEEVMRVYSGTEAAKDAGTLVQQIRDAEAKKKK